MVPARCTPSAAQEECLFEPAQLAKQWPAATGRTVTPLPAQSVGRRRKCLIQTSEERQERQTQDRSEQGGVAVAVQGRSTNRVFLAGQHSPHQFAWVEV